MTKFQIHNEIVSQFPKVGAAFSKIAALKQGFNPYSIGKRDSAGRWYPKCPSAAKYCNKFRSPSRAYPTSYLQAVSSDKFLCWYYDVSAVEMSAYRLLSRLRDSENGHDDLLTVSRVTHSAKRLERKLGKLEGVK
jgi:hypothetical protein